jgi:hypothetical protein
MYLIFFRYLNVLNFYAYLVWIYSEVFKTGFRSSSLHIFKCLAHFHIFDRIFKYFMFSSYSTTFQMAARAFKFWQRLLVHSLTERVLWQRLWESSLTETVLELSERENVRELWEQRLSELYQSLSDRKSHSIQVYVMFSQTLWLHCTKSIWRRRRICSCHSCHSQGGGGDGCSLLLQARTKLATVLIEAFALSLKG